MTGALAEGVGTVMKGTLSPMKMVEVLPLTKVVLAMMVVWVRLAKGAVMVIVLVTAGGITVTAMKDEQSAKRVGSMGSTTLLPVTWRAQLSVWNSLVLEQWARRIGDSTDQHCILVVEGEGWRGLKPL